MKKLLIFVIASILSGVLGIIVYNNSNIKEYENTYVTLKNDDEDTTSIEDLLNKGYNKSRLINTNIYEGIYKFQNEEFYKIKINTKDFFIMRAISNNSFQFDLIDKKNNIMNGIFMFDVTLEDVEFSIVKDKCVKYNFKDWIFYKSKKEGSLGFKAICEKNIGCAIYLINGNKKWSDSNWTPIYELIDSSINFEKCDRNDIKSNNLNIMMPYKDEKIELSNNLKINLKNMQIRNIANSGEFRMIIFESIENDSYVYSIKENYYNNETAKISQEYTYQDFYKNNNKYTIAVYNNKLKYLLFEIDGIFYDIKIKNGEFEDYKEEVQYIFKNIIIE